MATSDNVGGIAIYDTEALELRRIVRLPDEGGSPIAMSPDGREIVHIAGNFDETSLGFISTVDGSMPAPSLSPRERTSSAHILSPIFRGPRSSSRSSSE